MSSVNCELLARAAAKDALSRPPLKYAEDDGSTSWFYWADMTLGNRTILARCDARLIDIMPPDMDREAWLSREFLAFAEALVGSDQA